jgi:hypothetical protein
MGAPPPEETGSTKSRELYGNRVAALGKGRPTAPENSSHRAVTSPAAPLTSLSSRDSPDDNASKSTAQLTLGPISDSPSPSTLPSRRDSSSFTDQPVGPLDGAGGSDETQDTSVQDTTRARFESPPGKKGTNSSEPSTTTKRTSTASTGFRPPSILNTSSSTALVTTAYTPNDVSSSPLRATSSEGSPVQGSLTTYEETPTPAESHTQERPPVVTLKSDVCTIQPHIAVERVPVKENTINANSRGLRLDRPPQNDSLEVSSKQSVASSVTRPSSSIISSAENSKGGPASITSTTPMPKIKSEIRPSNSFTSSTTTPPAVAPVSGDLEESTTMSPPPVAEPGRRSFSAVVHRGDGDSSSDSRHSTTSRSSTITPRPSTSSFKTGADGGVVRSKRNFKHLGAVTTDPPPSPAMGGDLAALLQEAAWLEQRLYDENATPSALGEEYKKVETVSSKGPATTTTPAVVTSTRTKGRGLTLGPLTSAPSSYTSQSPIRSSPSTPSLQVHPETSPPLSKSARARKYFSLRGALRGPRLSMSSEMSSDDSAPVATPPSPSFDLQATQGHGNDTMSIRSMFSIRSNKSGKSDSGPGSLRISPRRGVARASSFAERFLNRASKTKSMLDDPGELPLVLFFFKRVDLPFASQDDAIPERSPMLPPIIPESPGALLAITPISASPKNERTFDRDIFDAFPDVPSEIPQRPASYLFPVPPKTAPPIEQNFRRSSAIEFSTSQNGTHDKRGWLRS